MFQSNNKKIEKIILVIIFIVGIILLSQLKLDTDNDIFIFYDSNKYQDKYIINNFLSSDEISQIINESNDYADKNNWSKTRHRNYPTTDNEITPNWNIYTMINNKISNIIFPFIELKYNIDKSKLGLIEIFVVKYSINGQVELDYHEDDGDFSFICGLNSEYTGGGTHFYQSDETIKLNVGECLVFGGKNMHKGNKIFSGNRLILTGFIKYNDNYSFEKIFIYQTKVKIYFSMILIIILILLHY
jgi:hypothetical protein